MGRRFLLLVLFAISVAIVYLFVQQWFGANFNAALATPATTAEARLAMTKEVAIRNSTTEVARSVTTTTMTTSTTTTEVAMSTSTSYEPFQGIIYNSPGAHFVFFHNSDVQKFQSWSGRREYKKKDRKLPRVLIFTWCTEDTFQGFVDEVYWKACYAHTHGFDLLFTSVMKLTGVKQWKEKEGNEFMYRWYSEENMWAWVHAVQEYLFSGDYDYVFVMAADVFILPINLEWPVWAWDRGHDITIMDDHRNAPPFAFGFNQNNVLLKPSNFTKHFLSEFFEYRKGFHLQGDNGPYMESLLTFLGYEAEANGKPGYEKKCLELMKLPAPNAHMIKYHNDQLRVQGSEFSECFYQELDRLAGPYGYRQSRNIGFHPTYFWDGSRAHLPASASFDRIKKPIGPWANCWYNPRRSWQDIQLNCFAYHWNGAKDDPVILDARREAYKNQGTCPDPSFKWDASPYNVANRQSARNGATPYNVAKPGTGPKLSGKEAEHGRRRKKV